MVAFLIDERDDDKRELKGWTLSKLEVID